jgi:flagellar hook protein FlgE
MFQALFNSLSGLFSFSRSLDVVSNNVANMNTPGFRGSDSFFANIQGGRGTRLDSVGLRSSQGELRPGDEPSNVAIVGGGFFVLRSDEGELYYTRAGQFRFDNDGILHDPVTGYSVMAMDAAGNLTQVNMKNHLSLEPVATTEVNVNGTVRRPTTGTVIAEFASEPITVYDASGKIHTLKVFLSSTGTAPLGYKVTVKEGSSVLSLPNAVLQFDSLGRPTLATSKLEVTMMVEGVAQRITLDFSDQPGTTSS